MDSPSSRASSPARDDVGFIMAQCSCSRRKAASALKLHKGNRDAAVKSLQDSVHLTSPRGGASPTPSPGRPKVLSDSRAVPPAISRGPHSHYQVPKPEGLLSVPAQTRVQLPPPPDSLAELSDPPATAKQVELDGLSSAAVLAVVPPDAPPESKVNGFPTKIESWNFQLPAVNIPIGEPPFSPDEGRRLPFSLVRLIATLGRGLSTAQLQHYLLFFEEGVVRRGLNEIIAGIPSIFYAVATNDENIVRTWVAHGTDVNAKEPTTGIPLLAFAILRTRAANEDTTAMLMTLLSLGADATVIPSALFSPCLEDPPEELHGAPHHKSEDPKTTWCNDTAYKLMAKTINLSQRYFLDKVLNSPAPTNRQSQVTRIHKATALLGVSHFLIGQTAATQLVSDVLISHLALPRSKPLVMAFTGPSGHGKTELAKRMGELLSLEICCVDCTEMKHETDLFGPKMPYLGYELGSPLNNFLTRNSGKRCIVFLDELEKTTREVQNALLVPFSEGRYSDRRNREAVDTSQTIWIFATNAADEVILDFFQIHEHHLTATDDGMRRSKLILQLTTSIKKQLKSTYGNPLSGRISVIVPFLPFSPVEAAVVAHKFVLEFKRRVLQSIRIEGKQLVGHVALEMLGDGAICKLIADEGYDCDQGARSLQTSVETRIGDAMVRAYLEEESQIDNASPLTKYMVSVARNGNIIVRKAGHDAHSGQEELYSAEQLSQQEVLKDQAAAGDADIPSGPVEYGQQQKMKQEDQPTHKSTSTKKPAAGQRPDKKSYGVIKSPSKSHSAEEGKSTEKSTKAEPPESSRTLAGDKTSGEGGGLGTDVQEVPRDDYGAGAGKAKEDRIKLMSSILSSIPKELSDKQISAGSQWREDLARKYPNLFKNLDPAARDQFDVPPGHVKKFDTLMSGFVGANKQQLQMMELFMSSLEGKSLNEEQQNGVDNLQQAMKRLSRNVQYVEKESSSFMDVLGLAEKMLWGPAMQKMTDFNSQSPDDQARSLEELRQELASIVPTLLGEDSEFLKDMEHVGTRGSSMLRRHLQPLIDGQLMMDPRKMVAGPPDLKDYDAFQYEQLSDTPSIRLLHFEDSTDSNPCFIKLRVEEVTLSSAPVFNALSYVWGDHRPPLFQQFNTKRAQWRFPILCNGQRIEVTYNLFCCLRRLAIAQDEKLSELRRMPLWIDQLCINQADEAEKSRQVGMMDEIYTSAQAVVSWLGEGGSLARGAAGLIDQLCKVPLNWIKGPDFDPATFVSQFSSDDWISLGSILARPYFKRVWIVQEIALAKKLLLVCGDQLLDWDRLIQALEVINASQSWPELSEYVLLFRPPEEQIPALGMRSPLRFGEELSMLMQAQRASRGSGLSPANLLFMGRRFDATQIVDKFFAMVCMAKRGAKTPKAAQLPPVNYSLSLKDVALTFADYYITHLGGTSFLSLVEDAKYRTDLSINFPSWLPDPAAPLLPVPLKAEGLRFDSTTSWYACGELQETKAPRIDQDRLLLRGFKLDRVRKTAMPFNLIDSTDEWYQLFDFIGEILEDIATNGFSVGQVLWRTLTTSFDRPDAKSVATAADLDEDFSNWCASLIVAIERHYLHTLGDSTSADFIAAIQRSEDTQFDIQVFGNSIKNYLEQDLALQILSRSNLHHHVMNEKLAGSEQDGMTDNLKPDRLLKASLKRLWARTGESDVFPSPAAVNDALDRMHETRRGTAIYKAAFDSVDRFEKALRKNLHSRCLFVTVAGRLGMGPHSAAPDDEIWILPGATVPFILRDDRQGGHTFVGEAFVFGMMHGEAVPDGTAVTLDDITIK